MKLQELTLRQFLEKTAANQAAPGGGGCAALNAAMGAALTEMVANLTIGRKKYAGVDERMREIAAMMSAQRNRFLEDVDRDAEAYRLVMEAYQLPKERKEEKQLRDHLIQETMKKATAVQMEIAERAFALLQPMQETLMKGNPHAVSDGEVGLMNCRTAILSALSNVRVNLGVIRDELFVAEMTTKCERMEKSTREIDLLRMGGATHRHPTADL